ncbi:MAG TPA: BrnT family toxin [Tardiphaga sp.]
MAKPFDPAKDAINRARHKISLDRATDMVIARYIVDERADYGEVRYRAWGHIDGEAYYLAFTVRDGIVRPISLRRAHAKEMKRHAP